MRSLSGSGAKLGQAEAIELAVVNERRLGPRPDHHLEGLLHPLPAVVAPQSVADELVLVEVGPVADADVESAARQVVEERQLGRQADRMAQGELSTAKPIRIRDVRAATTLANGIGSQYTLSPVKLCSVSQSPSKPMVSAKHAWATSSWIAS